MGTFAIAFDTIIVGALALPWAILVIHLFFSNDENRFGSLLEWANKQDWFNIQNQSAVAGVLLFAMAYTLGSAVSRLAQDYFNDDDLHVQVFGHLFRVGLTATEASILTSVYCEKRELIPSTLIDSLNNQPGQSQNDLTCQYSGKRIVPLTPEWINRKEDLVETIFRLQEGALLLKGTDATERLRQFHDQIMVLRGAAFNGLVAFALCLFWWSSQFHTRLRWAVPLAYLVPGLIATYSHLLERKASDPPLMEFTLLSLAAAGWYLLWKHRPAGSNAQGDEKEQSRRVTIRAGHLLLPAFLAATAFWGWCATQSLYDQQVIYSSYKASIGHPAR